MFVPRKRLYLPRKRLLLLIGIGLVMVMSIVALNWPTPTGADPTGSTGRRPGSGKDGTQEPETAPPERLSVLIVGTDYEEGRTDTIILATLDTGTGETHLLSIPRDTWVYIENHGWDKINHTYAVTADEDPAQAVVRTVSQLLGVPIEHHVVVHMEGFKKVVDLLGGIDVYIDADMYYSDPKDTPPLLIDFKAGQHRLNGEDALKYVRYRSDSKSDWGRMQRQQQFLKALAKEALQAKHMRNIPSLSKAIKAAIETDLGTDDLLRLSLSYKKFNLDELKTQTVGGYDRLIGGIYFMEPNLMDARTMAYRQVMGKEPPEALLAEARADFDAARHVIVSEIARFEALAEAEAEAEAEEEEESSETDSDDPTTGPGEPGDDGQPADGSDDGTDRKSVV